LAANRSEIAIRIFRAATELGLRTVSIYAQEDRFAMHRFKADEAYLVGEGRGPVAAYLDIESIVAMAKEKGVDAVHPGYGFLSENADFAEACANAGIRFIGPRAELLRMMGDKTWRRRRPADRRALPARPADHRSGEGMKAARQMGFPLIIKAASAGRARACASSTGSELSDLLQEAQAEAGRAFGNPPSSRKIHPPRQTHRSLILGDQHGNVIHLHERDCPSSGAIRK
jgi:pyruvate carboxylase